MAVKSIAEIKAAFANAKAKAATDPGFKQQLAANHLKALAQAPFNLTHEDWVAAYDDKNDLKLPPPTGPWQGG